MQNSAVHKLIRPILDSRLRRYIMDEDDFWPKVKAIMELTEPISNIITFLEGDSPNLSKIYPSIHKLESVFTEKLDFLGANDRQTALTMFKARKSFIFHPVQLAAYILDPKSKTIDLTDEEENQAFDFLLKFANDRNFDTNKILANYAEFKAKSGAWSNENIWRTADNIDAATWWKAFFKNQELSKAAIKILSFPSTSASCERNWSTYSLIQTRKRNRLTIERANKLVSIKFNLDLLSKEIFQDKKDATEGSDPTHEPEVPIIETGSEAGSSDDEEILNFQSETEEEEEMDTNESVNIYESQAEENDEGSINDGQKNTNSDSSDNQQYFTESEIEQRVDFGSREFSHQEVAINSATEEDTNISQTQIQKIIVLPKHFSLLKKH